MKSDIYLKTVNLQLDNLLLAACSLLDGISAEQKTSLIIVEDQSKAQKLRAALNFLKPDCALLFPEWETIDYQPELVSAEISGRQNLIISLLGQTRQASNPRPLLISSLTAACRLLNQPDKLAGQTLVIRTGDCLPPAKFSLELEALGYQAKKLADETGQFALHGNVIDFVAADAGSDQTGSSYGIRVEFNHEQIIERISRYAVTSQRSDSSGLLKTYEVLPLRLQAEQPGDLRALLDHPGLATATVINPELTLQNYQKRYHQLEKKFAAGASEKDLLPPDSVFKSFPIVAALIEQAAVTETGEMQSAQPLVKISPDLRVNSLPDFSAEQAAASTAQSFRVVLSQDLAAGYSVLIVISDLKKLNRLRDFFAESPFEPEQLVTPVGEWLALEASRQATLYYSFGNISEGIKTVANQKAIYTEADLFGYQQQASGSSLAQKVAKESSLKRLISTLSFLSAGDVVVHEDYGRGRYQGLKKITVASQTGEFLQIDYADSKLFLPVDRIGRIQKYQSATTDDSNTELDKLSSQRWQNIKSKVKKSVDILAGDLINLYAKRASVKAKAFPPIESLDQEFADYFPYEETVDQAKAINEVLIDLAKDVPMDRLICGDVGFGKTEVAMRAAFKVAANNSQVAILAPTTLLAQQHYENFRRRFKPFALKVRLLTRFQTAGEVRTIKDELASGKCDVLIGTHKILSRGLAFANLDLLVVDEEQRFGVKQKERLKQLKTAVHTLAMSATPIPRTLYMSLITIRDLSIIASAPQLRKNIKTTFSNYDPGLVADTIERELNRGGQVFYLHNRVLDLQSVKTQLQQLLPDVTFATAHGQMPEKSLESIMHEFKAQNIQVLITTTIIENGIDLPNVNTLIVDQADRFGLGQLYQIRGRVGRSPRQAYALLLVGDKKQITADATERLEALAQIDDLGQGFRLSMKDLEIRGTGNVLGKEQSGNINLIGYELFTKLVRNALDSLQGKTLQSSVEPELSIKEPAYIPDDYLNNAAERLILYQRFAGCNTAHEITELMLEIADRYGDPPQLVHNYSKVMNIRLILKKFGIKELKVTDQMIKLVADAQEHQLSVEKIISVCNAEPQTYKLSGQQTLVFQLTEPLELDQLCIRIANSLEEFAA